MSIYYDLGCHLSPAGIFLPGGYFRYNIFIFFLFIFFSKKKKIKKLKKLKFSWGEERKSSSFFLSPLLCFLQFLFHSSIIFALSFFNFFSPSFLCCSTLLEIFYNTVHILISLQIFLFLFQLFEESLLEWKAFSSSFSHFLYGNVI